MAKATIKADTKVVTKTVTVNEIVKTLNLQLTAKEVVALRSVLGQIGGSGDDTVREQLNAIYYALHSMANFSAPEALKVVGGAPYLSIHAAGGFWSSFGAQLAVSNLEAKLK